MGLFSGLMGRFRLDGDPRRLAWLLEQSGVLPHIPADPNGDASGASLPPLPWRSGQSIAASLRDKAAEAGQAIGVLRLTRPQAMSNGSAEAPGSVQDSIAGTTGFSSFPATANGASRFAPGDPGYPEQNVLDPRGHQLGMDASGGLGSRDRAGRAAGEGSGLFDPFPRSGIGAGAGGAALLGEGSFQRANLADRDIVGPVGPAEFAARSRLPGEAPRFGPASHLAEDWGRGGSRAASLGLPSLPWTTEPRTQLAGSLQRQAIAHQSRAGSTAARDGMVPVRAALASGGGASKPEYKAAAQRWASLKPEARLADPQLRDTAMAVEAAKRLIHSQDKGLRKSLGDNLLPESDFVARDVIWQLENRFVPNRIKAQGPSRYRSSAALAPGGQNSMYLLNEIRDAALVARNRRQREALAFFTSPAGGGSTKEQAAGIVANLTIESNLDPGKHQLRSKQKLGYGAAQWTLGEDRAADFERFAKRPLKGSSLQQQLAFVSHELMNSPVYRRAGDNLRKAKTHAEAALIFAKQYERMEENQTRYEERVREAGAVYDEHYRKRR